METSVRTILEQMTADDIHARLFEIHQKHARTPNEITSEEIVEEKRLLRALEIKRLDESSLEARNEDVRALAAHGSALTNRINAKLAEIVEKDLIAFHEVLEKLSELGGMPGSLGHEVAVELRTALKSGSLTNVEQRLIAEGWSHRQDVIELPIRSLRPPGQQR